MRKECLVVATAVLGLGAATASLQPAAAQCSVFSRHPCPPADCSVFLHGPCIPDLGVPLPQGLLVTIESNSAANGDASGGQPDREHPVNTIRELFDALRHCWLPPPADEASPGMQMSIRLSFKRSGELIGPPRVTYTTPQTPPDVRDRYREAITETIDRCTPMPFTTGMGGAIAGKPIAIRFVDNRTTEGQNK